ncbi:Cullin-3 [Tulasnella sp. 403]|nr:Cullin-3 [Tulasnella sp. 403]
MASSPKVDALTDPAQEAKNSVDIKLAIGKDKKAKADELFKSGDTKGGGEASAYPRSLMFPRQATLYIQGLDKNVMGAIDGSSTEPGKEKKTEADLILEKIFSNVCACHIKNQNWKRAEESANQVLKKNPDNNKAKFRKAKALAGQGYTEKAIVILEELHSKDPDDAEVKRELATVTAADKAATAKSMKKFKGMFSKTDSKREQDEGDNVEEVANVLEASRIEEVLSEPQPPDLWGTLEQSIREIHNHNAKNLSFEENYRYAYNMCLRRQGDQLYNGVCALVTENLDKLAKDIIIPAFPTGSTTGGDNIQKAQEGERLLKAIRHVWDDHIGSMNKLRDLLKYMDRTYIPNAKVLPIYEKGLQLFLERVIRSQIYPIKTHLLSTLLTQIQIEWDGYTINRSAVKGCVEVLMELQDRKDLRATETVYQKDFEPLFLRDSEVFYKSEGERLLESCDAAEYLRRVEERFNSERSRTQYYLSSHTEGPLISILEANLLTPHLQEVISMPSSGLDAMVDADKVDDLARMFRLFITVPTGLPVLRKALRESIMRRGGDINAMDANGVLEGEGEGDGDADEAMEDPKGKGKKRAGPTRGAASRASESALQWMQSVLDLKDRYERLLKVCFADNILVQTTISEAFESFINSNKKSPEYVSLFIDENLRKGLKGKSDQEVDTVLEKTITVFRFISERDVFERYYKSHLAKRLLQGRSVSDDAERGMLAKLKVECGVQFTQKLEGMFNDLKISSDHMIGYRDHLNKPHIQAPTIDMSVNVLTSTFWPMSLAAAPCTLPPELDQGCKVYERYYQSRHTGRRVTWQPSMGNADVRVTFKSRTHDLNVSTYALVILLLFENVDEGDILTYEEIKNATSIMDGELQRNLQSLACARFKILKKHPPGRDVNPDDSFSFNNDFSSPMQKIKISTVASKVENADQRKETMERVDEERKHQIEACIVRIMKDRKVLSHNELINEVTRQLSSRFLPSPIQIKKRIEALIERDYLDRADDKKSYVYQA